MMTSKHDILGGIYPVGSLIPTEQDLSLKYDVNRSALRKAVQMLADEGLIENVLAKAPLYSAVCLFLNQDKDHNQ